MSQSFLLGVPGKIKAVYDHLTTHLASARAAKIDNLDAAISSRAAASSALSNTTWSDARAAKLDGIIQSSVIASIQTGWVQLIGLSAGSGEDAYYKDTTITAVTSTAKCIVLWQDGGDAAAQHVTARLTSATNLRCARQTNTTITGRYTIIEFK